MTPPTRTRRPKPAEQAREAAGLPLEQVARYCRTSPAAIRRLERAGRGWSYQRAVRLAKLYGCPLDVFPPGGPTRPLSPSVRRALQEEKP